MSVSSFSTRLISTSFFKFTIFLFLAVLGLVAVHSLSLVAGSVSFSLRAGHEL